MANLKMAEASTTAEPATTLEAGAQVLSVQNLQAWYGESHILHGIDFNVKAGEVVVTDGQMILKPGSTVRIIQSSKRQTT